MLALAAVARQTQLPGGLGLHACVSSRRRVRPCPGRSPGGSRPRPSGAGGQFGVWVAHILVNKAITNASWSLSFTGFAAYNDGVFNADARMFHVIVPAPGAIALLGLAGLAGRRRRTA